MKNTTTRFTALIAILPLAIYAEPEGDAETTEVAFDEAIEHWVEPAQDAARTMQERYGEPQEVTPYRLVWHESGPWKRTMIVNEAVEHNFPEAHDDVLYQTVDYAVPEDKVSELVEFSGNLIIDRARGEITVRCENEESNRLTLNLAHQIIEGLKEPRSARDTLAEARLEGEHQDMLARLFFTPAQQAGRAPDVEYGAPDREDDEHEEEEEATP